MLTESTPPFQDTLVVQLYQTLGPICLIRLAAAHLGNTGHMEVRLYNKMSNVTGVVFIYAFYPKLPHFTVFFTSEDPIERRLALQRIFDYVHGVSSHEFRPLLF